MAGTGMPSLAIESSYQLPTVYGPVSDLSLEAVTNLNRDSLRASTVENNVRRGFSAAKLGDLPPEVREALGLTACSERGGCADTHHQTPATNGSGEAEKDSLSPDSPISYEKSLAKDELQNFQLGHIEKFLAPLAAEARHKLETGNRTVGESSGNAALREGSEIGISSRTFRDMAGTLSTDTKFLVTRNLEQLIANLKKKSNITDQTSRTAEEEVGASINLTTTDTPANTISLLKRRREMVNT